MKVIYAPYTLFADRKFCEVALLCGGIRMVMTGEEATALWAELGTALKHLYADRPERCPSVLAAFLIRQLADERQNSAKPRAAATDAELERVIDYARRPAASPNVALAQPSSPAPAASCAADSVLARIVRDAFNMAREKPERPRDVG